MIANNVVETKTYFYLSGREALRDPGASVKEQFWETWILKTKNRFEKTKGQRAIFSSTVGVFFLTSSAFVAQYLLFCVRIFCIFLFLLNKLARLQEKYETEELAKVFSSSRSLVKVVKEVNRLGEFVT